ncbi:MAG: sulfur carrier protein ThiS [Zetaproteobacteria bacterium]|nr:MAG: sulfur carrier protein ThiS [Zetaproteobacteria bacterium]
MSENEAKTHVIWLNGEKRSVAASTVAELVRALGLEKRTIAVERNLEVVPRSAWSDTPIADGDRIEIVHMIGGG